MKRSASRSGSSFLFLDNEGAKLRAHDEENATLHRQLNQEQDAVPCPECGWVQLAMIPTHVGNIAPGWQPWESSPSRQFSFSSSMHSRPFAGSWPGLNRPPATEPLVDQSPVSVLLCDLLREDIHRSLMRIHLSGWVNDFDVSDN